MENHTHEQRLDFKTVAPALMAHMIGFRKLQEESGIDTKLRELIKVRASQINGCAFCLEMHVREARAAGISDDRLHLLCVWREAPGFSESERAALELTEAVTRLSNHGVPEALYDQVRRHFNAEQYVDLLLVIGVINLWNRFMVGVGAVPPTFSPK